MATTNLISKSLGDILTESGNGTPDHTSPLGSLYVDKDTGKLWRNIDSGSSWEILSTVAYGEGYYQDNTSATSVVSSNTWYSAGNNLTLGGAVGFSASTDTLVCEPGYGGDYEIRLHGTLDYNAGTANYELGISINGAVPAAGTYGGCYIGSTTDRHSIAAQTIVTLTDDDTIEAAVRNLDNTSNVEVRHLQLIVRRIG
jgi:hypothetical protein